MHDHPGHADHDHSHDHEHPPAGSTRAEAEKLLQFTLRHNASHENELHELGHLLESLGLDAAAREVWYSLDDSKCASEHIERALEALK
ncbi:MAG: hypothetical protein LBT36_03590 [Oscillospiraceae bacterium]|jgi:hypothetical protein|nr:hypothetical protein [Oscillospiraceae bacterium]